MPLSFYILWYWNIFFLDQLIKKYKIYLNLYIHGFIVFGLMKMSQWVILDKLQPNYITQDICIQDSNSSHVTTDSIDILQQCSAPQAGEVWFLIIDIYILLMKVFFLLLKFILRALLCNLSEIIFFRLLTYKVLYLERHWFSS